MSIRKAVIKDHQAIQALLEDLGYPDDDSFVVRKMKSVLNNHPSEIYVYCLGGIAVGFIALDYIQQLGGTGDVMRISYLAVDNAHRKSRIGEKLREYAGWLAGEKDIDRIEGHYRDRRVQVIFYERRVYDAPAKYPGKKAAKYNGKGVPGNQGSTKLIG